MAAWHQYINISVIMASGSNNGVMALMAINQ